MKKNTSIKIAVAFGALSTALLSPLAALITPPDQLNVTGGGGGTTIITTTELSAELGTGGIADNTLSGTFVYSFTIEFTTLANGTGVNGFTGLQLYRSGAQRIAVGENWGSTNWGGFSAPGAINYDLRDSSDSTVPLAVNQPETFTVTIVMNAGADDVITINFRGKENVFTGPLDFDEVRVRCGNENQSANFTNISFDFTPSDDSDGDGLPDIWEQQMIDHAAAQSPPVTLTLADIKGPNNAPAVSDYDGDGLSEALEFVNLTNPTNPDTDGDGLSDGAEVLTHLTNPLEPDTDGDLLTDGAEINIHLTNPLVRDSDGDGIPDGLEVASGSNPNLASSIPAILTPFDATISTGQTIEFIDAQTIQSYLGFPLNDSAEGYFTYRVTLEFESLSNATGAAGFSALQLYRDGAENLAVGDYWEGTSWGGFFTGGDVFLLENAANENVPLATNSPQEFQVTIQFRPGETDLATVLFGGKETVFEGRDFSFNRVLGRTLGTPDQRVTLSNMSFQFSLTPPSENLPDLTLDIVNVGTTSVTLEASGVPGNGSQTFHLRASTGLDDWTPLLGTDFQANGTINLNAAILGTFAGQDKLFLQAWSGPAAGE